MKTFETQRKGVNGGLQDESCLDVQLSPPNFLRYLCVEGFSVAHETFSGLNADC
jgi:hypothetical protein